MTNTLSELKNDEITDDLTIHFDNEFLTLPDSIEIYTCKESKPNTDCNWFYTILDLEGYLVKEASGKAIFCDCSECRNFGEKRYEYYSLFQALTALEGYSGASCIDLWVSSDSFISDYSQESLGYYGQFYKCPFLQMLGVSLNTALKRQNIDEIFHYSYANRDIIKMFF